MARPDLMWLIRLVTFSTVLVFSVVVLGLSANIVAQFHTFTVDNIVVVVHPPAWSALALAVSVISLVVLGDMVIVDILRRGAISSRILVEVIVAGVLCVLWLASAADTTSATLGIPIDCGAVDDLEGSGSFDSVLCHSYQAIEAFGFLNWLILMVYAIALLVMSIMASGRGNKAIWSSTVRDTDFFVQKQENISMPMTQPQAYAAPVPQAAVSPQYTGYGTPSPQPQAAGYNAQYAAQV